QRHGRALQERRSTCAAALTCKVRCVKCEVRVGTRAKRALTLHLTLYTLHYDCEFTVAHRPTSPDLVRLRRPQGFAVATRSDAVSRVGIGSDAAADAGDDGHSVLRTLHGEISRCARARGRAHRRSASPVDGSRLLRSR